MDLTLRKVSDVAKEVQDVEAPIFPALRAGGCTSAQNTADSGMKHLKRPLASSFSLA